MEPFAFVRYAAQPIHQAGRLAAPLMSNVIPHQGISNMSRKFELYDENNRYYYGEIKDNGNLELYDDSNQYYYGKLKDNGNIEYYDSKNDYYYGKLKSNGNIEVYDKNNKHLHGKIKS
jgi:uncharacterized pyridoxamine 5'-phosphate oxidase family protein